MHVLHFCDPSFVVLDFRGANHLVNVLLWLLQLQLLHVQCPFTATPLVRRAHSLQTLSRGCFLACSEKSVSGFSTPHLKHCNTSGRTHVLQTRFLGVRQALFEKSFSGFFTLHLIHSFTSGRTHALHTRCLGCVQAFSENSLLLFLPRHLMHCSTYTQSLHTRRSRRPLRSVLAKASAPFQK